jgi:phosphoserine phosphatase RsbU/P
MIIVIYLYYDRPVKQLEYTIKRFLVGSLKEGNIQLKKTANPHLNYVLFFFGKTLDTLKHIKSEFIHGKEIKSEIDLAGEIQEKLLRKEIPQIPNLEIVGKSKPAAEIGGDSFDIIPQGENYYIYVWDATGHGVGAWFIMVMVNALVSAFSKVTPKGNNILALTNEIVKPRVKANLLMSMLLLRWNAPEQRMYMTGAGHEYLMIYKHAQKKCFQIKSGGVALGMIKDATKLLKEREISFEPNDVIVLYSDGITEAINQNKKDGNERMFGEELLVKAIEEAPNMQNLKTARSIFRNISISLSQFMGYQHVQLDDITLVTIQYISPEYKREADCSEEMGDDFVTEWKWEK